MNLLMVDDQKNVIAGMQKGIRWERLPVERVFAANSAREARIIMNENQIDAMLCDIEMPEEDGLKLFRWVKSNYEQIKCLFLTSHAEFEFARDALNLGSFGYILQPAPYEEIEEAIRRLGETLDSEEKIRHLALYGQEYLITGRTQKPNKLSDEGQKEEEQCEECGYVEQAVRYIRKNIGADIHRSDIAKEVNLNEDYLSRIFKRQMGLPIKEYILKEKMFMAQNLLKNTNFSVGTISARVGFDNFSHFSQIYKKMMGKTPGQERKC